MIKALEFTIFSLIAMQLDKEKYDVDPYFQDIPWDLIYDENGELIGEVYIFLPDPPPNKRVG